MKFFIAAATLLLSVTVARADEPSASLSDWGSVGLLQTPTARMAPDGTMSGGLTGLGDLHRHVAIAVQALPWLEVTARNSVYPGYFGLTEPGLDVKLRLRAEDGDGPALVVGGRDVTGSGLDLPGKGRFAGEYVALSRRWWDFDLSLGLGWGTLGEAGHFRNPLRFLGGRFRRDRDPSWWPSVRGPRAWFTGERVALFGGVEWHTPIPDLSLKIETTGDTLRGQRQDQPGFTAGSRYNVGLAYRPFSWVDLGAGFEQGRRAMLRLSLRFDPAEQADRDGRSPPPVGPRPSPETALPADEIVTVARAHGLPARAARIDDGTATLWLDPAGRSTLPLAREVGHAARLLADLAPPDAERLRIVTGAAGLDGAALTLLRRDLERATRHRGSVDELWRTAGVAPTDGPPPSWRPRLDFGARVAAEFDLAELGTPLAVRTHTDLLLSGEPAPGWVLGGGLRINTGDQLALLDTNALPVAEPVRSDLPRYTLHPVSVEHLHASWLARPADGLTTRVTVGYPEEMFAGVGAEALYQPLTARWAAGLDLNRVWKRRPSALFAVLPDSDRLTGHASLYWESPGAATTSALRLGRYLGGDWGGTIEVTRRFAGGVALSAQATWTEGPDGGQSRFGGRMDWGMALSVPLNASGWLPVGGTAETAVRTLGRDAGQRLRHPLPLYDTRVPGGFGRLAGTWSTLLD
ncbi:YjbH domain-containing protein [Azospirillum agricola]|uniref:YjbH domain-containing protein n=1 Tax=Azospirillum agricola TaxID=1720247 RepID=UPI000A0F3DAC|nr:YjbH domain-containing protein [Azospirillum agricola]SMH58837.1 Exopolysaccharide biosynthesis protein YbjH [Azospirillum lipoferum]